MKKLPKRSTKRFNFLKKEKSMTSHLSTPISFPEPSPFVVGREKENGKENGKKFAKKMLPLFEELKI